MPYVQHTPEDLQKMLAAIGVERLEQLFRSIPAALRLNRPLAIAEKRTEAEIVREFTELGERNRRVDSMPSFLGAGVYHRFIPAAVDYLSSRGEFNTSYTPYQPEVSQGTLQAIFEYQSMIARLTGMEIANASMYEAGTALAEAILMAYAIHGKGRKVLVSDAVHPEYRRVLETYFRHHPIRLESIPLAPDGRTDSSRLAVESAGQEEVFAVAIQSPNFFGVIEDGRDIRQAADRLSPNREEALRPFLIAAVDPISLAVLSPPGDYGADIAVGDGQALGNEPNLGGPTFGFFATREAHVRKIPGRIVGETVDQDGKRGYVLTFQTREQHIRRERATSNLCTNQGLMCLRGAMAMAFLGEKGLRQMAELSARLAHHACEALCRLSGVRRVFSAPFFQEFTLELPLPAREAYKRLLARGVRGGLALDRYFPERSSQMLFAVTEMTRLEEVDLLVRHLRELIQIGAPDAGREVAPPAAGSVKSPLEAVRR
ncbi:MAG: aminomethyl-transferring glycine dehydrogenase subunit GcvPA [Planctomycetes bacterium]|nr:aminomethyl-transferring glycine dehydrogenase subunit GcvPA [Planctomycetota bacterium]